MKPYRCGHPRTAENTSSNGPKRSGSCRECRNARARGFWHRHKSTSRPPGRQSVLHSLTPEERKHYVYLRDILGVEKAREAFGLGAP